MIASNTELPRRLTAGGFAGCAYGFLSQDGPPFIALLGQHIDSMRSALGLMREWAAAAGPNSIRLEILFDGTGYVFSIGQHLQLMRWRLRGIDVADDSLLLSVNVIKRMDTRHSFLEQLAKYAREPVSPVYLTVAAPSHSVAGGLLWSGPNGPDDFDLNGIMLPGIEVYSHPDERPKDSMVRLEREIPPEEERSPPDPNIDPASVAQRRERRLLATMPKTMHVLRNREDGRTLVNECIAGGSLAWQVEQAVCNIHLALQLPYEPRSNTKKIAMLNDLRRSMVQPASAVFDIKKIPRETILEQISLDMAFLFRRLEPDHRLPADLLAGTARLRSVGYA